MKEVRDLTGRFNERPHYEPHELDNECENIICTFLRNLYGQIIFPIQTNDITKLIEKYASDLDLYADLTEYGQNVEGLTKFIPQKKPEVCISKNISESTWGENRFRTTLTHELGHVVFHNYLFQMKIVDAKGPLQICKRDDIITSKKSPGKDWMEWQAGYACGAFLMPASFVMNTTKIYCKSQGVQIPLNFSSTHKEGLIDIISSKFKVSIDAARVRLSILSLLQ
jgi:Zn-dependent peptidase ImmA (M78 family)